MPCVYLSGMVILLKNCPKRRREVGGVLPQLGSDPATVDHDTELALFVDSECSM